MSLITLLRVMDSMVLVTEFTATTCKCDFSIPARHIYIYIWRICATSSGNLIVIWHFASVCLWMFLHLWLCIPVFEATAPSEIGPQMLSLHQQWCLCSGDGADSVPRSGCVHLFAGSPCLLSFLHIKRRKKKSFLFVPFCF